MYNCCMRTSHTLIDMFASYDSASEAPRTKFRADQLLFRELEIYLAHCSLADLVNSYHRAEAGMHKSQDAVEQG